MDNDLKKAIEIKAYIIWQASCRTGKEKSQDQCWKEAEEEILFLERLTSGKFK